MNEMTDAEVEAVARAIYEADDPWHAAWPWPNLRTGNDAVQEYRRVARAALTAVLSARGEQESEVKALEWAKDNTVGGHGGWLGRCGDFTRAIKIGWMVEKPYEFVDQAFATLDEAKAAAQSDFARRIRSALAPKGAE